jgi:ELWxxDGT repeat protein
LLSSTALGQVFGRDASVDAQVRAQSQAQIVGACASGLLIASRQDDGVALWGVRGATNEVERLRVPPMRSGASDGCVFIGATDTTIAFSIDTGAGSRYIFSDLSDAGTREAAAWLPPGHTSLVTGPTLLDGSWYLTTQQRGLFKVDALSEPATQIQALGFVPPPFSPVVGIHNQRLIVRDGGQRTFGLNLADPGAVERLPVTLFDSRAIVQMRWCLIVRGDGEQLWRVDGSIEGTAPITGDNTPTAGVFRADAPGFVDDDGFAYIVAEGTGPGPVLIRTGGTVAETSTLGTLFNATSVNSYQVSRAGASHVLVAKLSDRSVMLGIRHGAVTLLAEFAGAARIEPGPESNGRLFFVASQPGTGREVWTTDGTPTGTGVLTDLMPGSGSSDPRFLRALPSGGVAFIARAPSASGNDVRPRLFIARPDGTIDEIRSVRSSATGLEVLNGLLYVIGTLPESDLDGLYSVNADTGDTTLVKAFGSSNLPGSLPGNGAPSVDAHLRPEPSVNSFCAADLNHSGGIDLDDLFILLGWFFASDARADVDLDGDLNIDDVFRFLRVWFAGCE